MDKIKYCPNCGTRAVRRNAGILNNIPYWYCPKCKKELSNIYHREDDLWDPEWGICDMSIFNLIEGRYGRMSNTKKRW